MKVQVPTLGFKGWVNDIASAFDVLMAHSLVSDYSQSNRFYGHVTSLSSLVARYGQDPLNMVTKTESAYHTYLARYFDSVEVSVTQKATTKNGLETGGYNLFIGVKIYENGQQYDLYSNFEIMESTFKQIVGEANGNTI